MLLSLRRLEGLPEEEVMGVCVVTGRSAVFWAHPFAAGKFRYIIIIVNDQEIHTQNSSSDVR
jgi:hypothetical protein